MNLIDTSNAIVNRIYPNESWVEQYTNVFVAKSRKPKNSEQKKVFEKEVVMAKIAADKGHIVFLLPEYSVKKSPDALLDAEYTEFKNVTGNENSVSHRFREALRQGRNVYLKIDSDINVRRIKQILSGVLKEKDKTGKIYCYITRLDVLYTWVIQDFKQNKAPNGAPSLPQADKNQNSDNINISQNTEKSSGAEK